MFIIVSPVLQTPPTKYRESDRWDLMNVLLGKIHGENMAHDKNPIRTLMSPYAANIIAFGIDGIVINMPRGEFHLHCAHLGLCERFFGKWSQWNKTSWMPWIIRTASWEKNSIQITLNLWRMTVCKGKRKGHLGHLNLHYFFYAFCLHSLCFVFLQ